MWTLRKDLAYRAVGDDIYCINAENREVRVSDPVGVLVLSTIAQGGPDGVAVGLEDLVNVVVGVFDAPCEQVRNDVECFLEDLVTTSVINNGAVPGLGEKLPGQDDGGHDG